MAEPFSTLVVVVLRTLVVVELRTRFFSPGSDRA
jgi:hypothetical protein